MGIGDLCRVSPAAVRHGNVRHSGTGLCGECRRVLWVPGPRGQYSGTIRLIEKHWVQDYGDRHVPKRSSDLRCQSSGTGPIASCVYCCPVAFREISIQVKFILSSSRGRSVPGAPSSRCDL